ncbi:flagellar protein FlhE [Enterobacter sp. DC4]|uniref:flagellar protein FlhE n=1 Tax=Enterobacter sp. DC4 TaxID=1395580 RepID=UPI00067F21DA|nr:flagellar protein FlhE [Enterobacter sp. DC4]
MLPLLLSLPLTATAVAGGSWSQQSTGGTVSVGKQLLVGRTLSSPAMISHTALVREIGWKITLLSPPPRGLEVKLCRREGCLQLPALAGHMTLSHPWSAIGDFRFLYSVNSTGQLIPALTVVRNQLTVNYR